MGGSNVSLHSHPLLPAISHLHIYAHEGMDEMYNWEDITNTLHTCWIMNGWREPHWPSPSWMCCMWISTQFWNICWFCGLRRARISSMDPWRTFTSYALRSASDKLWNQQVTVRNQTLQIYTKVATVRTSNPMKWETTSRAARPQAYLPAWTFSSCSHYHIIHKDWSTWATPH